MGTHPIFESDFDCLTELKLLKMGKNNGKRKINYKQVYGGTDSQDIKRCKYSGNSVDPSDKTHGFLMSYRRKCLKQCHREAFSIAKFFTNQVYPDLIDANGDRVVNSALVSEENVEVDIENNFSRSLKQARKIEMTEFFISTKQELVNHCSWTYVIWTLKQKKF